MLLEGQKRSNGILIKKNSKKRPEVFKREPRKIRYHSDSGHLSLGLHSDKLEEHKHRGEEYLDQDDVWVPVTYPNKT